MTIFSYEMGESTLKEKGLIELLRCVKEHTSLAIRYQIGDDNGIIYYDKDWRRIKNCNRERLEYTQVFSMLNDVIKNNGIIECI